MSRLSHDEYFVKMLALVAERATCGRRSVGAVIVSREHHVLATGYNGVPKRFPHCQDEPCPGRYDSSGNSDRCLAIHAEINALLQCRALPAAATLYVSCAPCFSCAKAITNTNIRRVVYVEGYADMRGLNMLKLANVATEQFVIDSGSKP